MASDGDLVPAEETTNGEKNGDSKEEEAAVQKLSLGEIAAVDEEIAKAKTEQLQLLHNLFYGKNGSGPQIKRNIRKFAGFEADERQKKLDQLLTSELPALLQTVTILDIKDIKPDVEKDVVAKAIVDFLITPSGKTIAEVEKENPVKDDEDEDAEDEEVDDEEEEEEEEVKPKGSPRKKGGDKNKSGRPKRATASKVWTNDYGSSEEEEEVEEVKPKVGRKKKNESDSGSDYNPNVSDDSDALRRKSARNPVKKPTRGRKKNISESEEEESISEDFSEEELPKKKKAPPARGTPKRGAPGAKRGRKRKQETESEESEPEEDEEDQEMDSDDSEKQKKKKPTPKSTPQKNSKGRPKRAAPPAKKKKKDESEDEESDDEPEESEDDEPLKKPPKKAATTSDKPAAAADSKGPSDDDIKTLLKDILAEANLEEITMKTVCKKVYAHYPGHDLTLKKDFIKQTVKSLIAA